MNRGIERRVWTLTLNILVISKDWTTPELDGYLTTYSGWLQGGGNYKSSSHMCRKVAYIKHAAGSGRSSIPASPVYVRRHALRGRLRSDSATLEHCCITGTAQNRGGQ